MMCFLWQHDFFLWYLPGTACLYSGPSPVRRPGVSPEPSAARMPLLILWLLPTEYCCRERQNSLFVLQYTSSRVWFLAICAASWLVYDVLFLCICIFLWHNRRTLYEAKQGCGVVSSTTFSYRGACWSKVLILIWYHTYVREDCYFWFFIEIFHFLSRYLVVGSRYVFFFGFNNMRRNTCRSDFVRYQAKTWKRENSRV